MKFLFVTPSLSNGGAERVVSILSSELTKLGHQADIVIYFKKDEEYEVSQSVNKIYLANSESDYFKISHLNRLFSLRKIIKAQSPDYVIPFLWYVCIHVCVALLGLNFKIIQTVRNNPSTAPYKSLLRFIRNLFIKHSYKIMVQNNEQKNYFNKRLQKKIFVLPNPVRGDLFDAKREEKEERLIIASAGRLNLQKNFFMLIDAVEKVSINHKNIQLRIYGDGELRQDLQKYIDDKKSSEFVKLMGRTNDMKGMLSSIDLYVLSSDFEGMPNSLMEAMAAGVPCVSTDCPTGPSDLIHNGENGLLVPVNNSEAMADAIEKMLFELDKKELAQKGRDFVKFNYSPEIIAEKLVEILKS